MIKSPDDDWQGPLQSRRAAGWLTGSLAQMVRGFPWLQLENRDTYVRGKHSRVSEEDRESTSEWNRKRWTDWGASDLLCCCLGILNKHIHERTLTSFACLSFLSG